MLMEHLARCLVTAGTETIPTVATPWHAVVSQLPQDQESHTLWTGEQGCH